MSLESIYLNPAKIELGPEVTRERLSAVYDDVELAILFDWLRVERPERIQNVDPTSEIADVDSISGQIRLAAPAYGADWSAAISNAVARFAISGIQRELPQWACSKEDRTAFGRKYSKRRQGPIEVIPRFQFEINWADSGPGFSWPEAYYTTLLPIFDLYVVTASQDSPDAHGFTDEAIGCYGADVPTSRGVHDAVVGWWQRQAAYCGQHRWSYLFNTGAVDEKAATAWANEVWDCDTGEPRVA